MGWIKLVTLVCLCAGGGIFLGIFVGEKIGSKGPEVDKIKLVKALPLIKYEIENLANRNYKAEIVSEEAVATHSGKAEQSYTVNNFYFVSDGKKVTGLATIPDVCTEKCPVIVQLRGYADVKTYYPGYGTEHSAQYLAKQGFISLAPDFLGYGGSASPSADVWEARFETYVTAANLLAAVEKWDKTEEGRIGLWGHSNGGQIALTTLEITGKAYPTVLWAPVSAPFPYSVLFYTDDDPDHGKVMRQSVAQFEQDYDTERFALINYLDKIKAPILLQQGTDDEQVPVWWSRNLIKKIQNYNPDLKVGYVEYPGADHNLTPGWNDAVVKDAGFYNKYFLK